MVDAWIFAHPVASLVIIILVLATGIVAANTRILGRSGCALWLAIVTLVMGLLTFIN